MKTIILAAGMGSRLGDPTLPKPLTKLANGQSILEFMLKNLSSHLSMDEIIIVVGYRKELIMEAFPDLLYVFNPHFSKENTSKSLLRALRKVQDDVLWINGDVVFHPSVLDEVKAYGKTGMVVNVGKVGEEEVKYRTDEKGTILEVSKRVQNPQGEALGINFFKKADLNALKTGLEKCAAQDYFEKGIEYAIQEGLKVGSIPVDHSHCAEIDFPDNLNNTNRMLASW